MKRDYIVDSIIAEYKIKKKYEQKAEMQKFQRKNCIKCKNKYTNKCEIRRDINGELNCIFYET